MGHLLYGFPAESIDLDDRTLAHLQIVVGSKLRRSENFWIEFVHGVDEGGGREVIWIDHAIPLLFRYVSAHHPETDQDWVDELVAQSSNKGHVIIKSSAHGA
ncbi:MAG: ATP-dependent ligase [Microbacteriaceae bacterium]|jgi:hypothetical protein|nr:ATP-dependent ligase [Microbacteriaceae bacterium]